jgi:hypothetical protein
MPPSPSLRCLKGLVPLLALVACGQPMPPAPVTGAPAASPFKAADVPEFCAALERILRAANAGFTELRSRAAGPAVWEGALVPVGLDRCSVVGNSRFEARYVCLAGAAGDNPPVGLTRDFERLAGEIDACLAAPDRVGGRFARSQLYTFKGGERLAVWRDISASPAPGFALRLEEDLDGGGFALGLSGVSFR